MLEMKQIIQTPPVKRHTVYLTGFLNLVAARCEALRAQVIVGGCKRSQRDSLISHELSRDNRFSGDNQKTFKLKVKNVWKSLDRSRWGIHTHTHTKHAEVKLYLASPFSFFPTASLTIEPQCFLRAPSHQRQELVTLLFKLSTCTIAAISWSSTFTKPLSLKLQEPKVNTNFFSTFKKPCSN